MQCYYVLLGPTCEDSPQYVQVRVRIQVQIVPPEIWIWAVRPKQSRIHFCWERGWRYLKRRNKIFKNHFRTCFAAYFLTVVHRLIFWFALKCSHIEIWSIFEPRDDWTLFMPCPWYLSLPMCLIPILIILDKFLIV